MINEKETTVICVLYEVFDWIKENLNPDTFVNKYGNDRADFPEFCEQLIREFETQAKIIQEIKENIYKQNQDEKKYTLKQVRQAFVAGQKRAENDPR